MRPTTSKTWLFAGALALCALTGAPGTAPATIWVRKVPPASAPAGPAAAVAPKPVGTGRAAPAAAPVRTAALNPATARSAPATAAAYWGPAAPPAPKRKPSAVGRFFHRIGKALGSDEEMGSMPTYRDPTTGRAVTGTPKPWMQKAPE